MFSTLPNLLYNYLDFHYSDFLFENDLKIIIPESFLVIALFVLLLYAVLITNKTSSDNSEPILIVNTSCLALVIVFFTLVLVLNNPVSEAAILYNTFQIDNLSRFLKMLLLLASGFSILIALEYVKQESLNQFEIILLILLSCTSMLFLISSADFISMYLAIELQSLCFYVMAGIKRNSEFSTEAGLKYFLLGAFSSGILLFGCSLQYGFTGTCNFSDLAKIFESGSDIIQRTDLFNDSTYRSSSLILERTGLESFRASELGMVCILAGLLFKLTSVPFHMWAPDVYEGAPLSVTAFFAIVPKISVLAVIIRLCYQAFFDFMLPWQKILLLSSIASMILGALAALSQNKIKRLLAWSSIGHVGFFLVGICCATVSGIQALLLYLIIYLVITINLFALVLSPVRRQKVAGRDIGKTSIERLKYITDLAFCAKTNPVLAFTMTVTMFSIAGIPPLAGFYSKAFLMFAAMSCSQYVLALVALFSSVVSCFYYIRIVKIMYFEKPSNYLSFMQIPKESAFVLAITSSFLLFFCINPTPFFLVTHKMALSLCF